MKIKVLGCSAGIGDSRRTSCCRLDGDILLDAGTGAGELSLQDLIGIEHVFLTHAHLDHAGLLPLVVDAAGHFRDRPVTVHALDGTLSALRECMFNGRLWPDYAALPSPERPFLRYKALEVGATLNLDGRKITPLPARHAVPAAGYLIDSGRASLALSGDTTLCDAFWEALARVENLKYLLIETAFPNADAALAAVAGHMTADLLAAGLSRLRRPVEVYVTHLEPGREDLILAEIEAACGGLSVRRLRQGMEFEF
ncbi:MAG: 3',5'-cyclic-nucleotide phosphodiesterase [Sulfuricella sp.]|nr:3',5'-cyclic-nucleotide phosphodiesterase [Sulfuricella sp.]